MQNESCRPPIISIDFDLTIIDSNDQPFPGVIRAINFFKRLGAIILIHSYRANTPEGFEFVRQRLKELCIPYDTIWSGKPPADIFIDDRSIRFDGDWNKVISQLFGIPTTSRDILVCDKCVEPMMWEGEYEEWVCPKCFNKKVLYKEAITKDSLYDLEVRDRGEYNYILLHTPLHTYHVACKNIEDPFMTIAIAYGGNYDGKSISIEGVDWKTYTVNLPFLDKSLETVATTPTGVLGNVLFRLLQHGETIWYEGRNYTGEIGAKMLLRELRDEGVEKFVKEKRTEKPPKQLEFPGLFSKASDGDILYKKGNIVSRWTNNGKFISRSYESCKW